MPAEMARRQDGPCTIDLAPDGQLLVHVPGANRGHPFKLPFDLRGLACLSAILHGRQAGKTAIGRVGAPTQWDVEQWLKDHRPKPHELDHIEVDL